METLEIRSLKEARFCFLAKVTSFSTLLFVVLALVSVVTILPFKIKFEAKLFVNGVSEREYAVDTKTGIRGVIEWTNNLDTKINDLEIIVHSHGELIFKSGSDTEWMEKIAEEIYEVGLIG